MIVMTCSQKKEKKSLGKLVTLEILLVCVANAQQFSPVQIRAGFCLGGAASPDGTHETSPGDTAQYERPQ